MRKRNCKPKTNKRPSLIKHNSQKPWGTEEQQMPMPKPRKTCSVVKDRPVLRQRLQVRSFKHCENHFHATKNQMPKNWWTVSSHIDFIVPKTVSQVPTVADERLVSNWGLNVWNSPASSVGSKEEYTLGRTHWLLTAWVFLLRTCMHLSMNWCNLVAFSSIFPFLHFLMMVTRQCLLCYFLYWLWVCKFFFFSELLQYLFFW